MKSLFLSPHNDDETLFGAFTLLRYRSDVLVCLRSRRQEEFSVYAAEREAETHEAMQIFGCQWTQSAVYDVNPDWGVLLGLLEAKVDEYDQVFAPLPANDGHEQHNHVGTLAGVVFGGRVTYYTTYTKQGKMSGQPVPYEPSWLRSKLLALACYRSQIATRDANCWPHFARDLAEYYV